MNLPAEGGEGNRWNSMLSGNLVHGRGNTPLRFSFMADKVFHLFYMLQAIFVYGSEYAELLKGTAEAGCIIILC